MGFLPHIMVLDDDPRVLDSLVPGFIQELGRRLRQSEQARRLLGWEKPVGASALSIRVTPHGYASERLRAYRHRAPHHLQLHLVCERGGRFDVARRLLNEQLFGVVISDLRFSDDAGGQRAGQLFVDEIKRVHPELQGLLYSAYPRPEGFPENRFVRKGGEEEGSQKLAVAVVEAFERHLNEPAVAGFAAAVTEQGLVYQSDSFGKTLSQVFALARLFGPPQDAGRGRRPLPCLLLDGESGTGKRGLAAVFHAASERRKLPLVVASCNELTNETLLRSTLFGHKRGAFTDAREDRAGLVATAGRGMLLIDDFHRLPTAGSAILHSFLEDGEYARLGEEETRRRAEAGVVLTVETGPWAQRRRSGELPLAFLARVERLPLEVPPLRERREDIGLQARVLTSLLATELHAELELAPEVVQRLEDQAFAESNSRELRNLIEQAVIHNYREVDELEWRHFEPLLLEAQGGSPAEPKRGSTSSADVIMPVPNDWQRRLRSLAIKILERGAGCDRQAAEAEVAVLFDQILPSLWNEVEAARELSGEAGRIPLPVWEDLVRCFAVSWLGGPSPAERSLGIPANTLRQWINDRESR